MKNGHHAKAVTHEIFDLYAETANQALYIESDALYAFRYRLSSLMDRMVETGKPADELIQDFFFLFDDDDESSRVRIEDGLAIVSISGPITNRDPKSFLVRRGIVASYAAIRQDIADAVNNSNVRAIAGVFDTPGGIGMGLFDAMEEIAGYRGQKSMYALIHNDAFSAGYGLASAMDQILVSRDSRAGSVGSIIVHEDISERLKALGINVNSFTYGKKKDQFASFKPLSDEARAEYQAMVDKHGREFVELTAKHLGASFESIRALEAGIYSGQDAVNAGLAHKVMSYEAALDEIKSRHSNKTKKDKGVKSMTLDELKKKDPEAYNALVAEVKSQVKEEVTGAVRAELEPKIREEVNASAGGGETKTAEQIQELRATVEQQNQLIATQNDKIQTMEKNEAKRSFQAIKDTGDSLWEAALAKSDIPVGYHAKAKKCVVVKDFVDENGAFDRDGFTKAVNDEIADWEKVDGEGSIRGVGAGGGQMDSASDDASDDAEVDSMLSAAGQKPKGSE